MEEAAAVARRERLKALRAAHELLSTPDDPPPSAASPPPTDANADADADADADDAADGGAVPSDAGVGYQQAPYFFLPLVRSLVPVSRVSLCLASWNLLKVWEFCRRSEVEIEKL